MRRLLRTLLPILVIVVAVAGARALMLAEPHVEAEPQAKREVPVTVLRAQSTAHPTQLQALGEVKPIHRLATVITLPIAPSLYLAVEDVRYAVRWYRGEPLVSTQPAEQDIEV